MVEKVMAYKAADGTLFENKKECARHDLFDGLQALVIREIDCTDSGSKRLTNLMFEHADKIVELLLPTSIHAPIMRD